MSQKSRRVPPPGSIATIKLTLLAVALSAALLMVIFLYNYRQNKQVEQHALTTIGTITNKGYHVDYPSSVYYYLDYRYQPSGSSLIYNGVAKLESQSVEERAQIGSSLTVTYDSQNPGLSQLTGIYNTGGSPLYRQL